MELTLSLAEARVLGVLVEKESTTPDAYPLSLNAIVTACNQKTSRYPLMSLSEREVQDAVDRLVAASLVRSRGAAGGRVPRFEHRLRNRLFGEHEFSRPELAVMCLLLVRGAQTAGEVRTRAGRLHDFDSVEAVEAVLRGLAERADGPYVHELLREPGRRENRFVHLLCGNDIPEALLPPAGSASASAADPGRVGELEARVAELEARVAHLEANRPEG